VQPEQYLQHIRGQRVMTHPSMVSQASQAFSPTQHRQSIAETFALSYRQLDALDALDAIAMALLARIACFAPGESIADTLLQATLQDVVAPAESLLIEDARQRLLNLGLIESGTQRDIRMHRLLVDFVQQQIKETPVAEQARHAVEQAIFDIALQAERARAIDQIIALQRHLRPITDLAIPRSDAHALELCGVLGWHLTLLDENQPAAFYCEQALTIALHLYGDAHPQTAACYNRLGLRAQYVGAFTEAEPRFAQASMIWEQSYGSAHLQTLDAYHNLGYVQGLRGAYSSAFANLRRCANLRRRVLGLYHPETARTIHNIGRLHGWQGNARTALRYLQLAYRIRQQTLPPLHMALAQTLNAIGEAYFANNELAMAEQYHQQALTIRNTLFGLAHSETAESLMHIAHVWVKQGLLEAGRTQLEQALAIYIQFSGPHAIATAWCYECIGEVFEVLHDEAQAAFYLNQALAIYEAQYIPGDLRIQRLREHLLALPVQ
jgi:tetratricopeptide (TPR) repeat protein